MASTNRAPAKPRTLERRWRPASLLRGSIRMGVTKIIHSPFDLAITEEPKMSVTIGHTDTPDTGRLQGAERFRLKLSGPAWKTPKWLSLNVGDALAYKWYIIFGEERDSAATRVFTWYTHSNKKTY